MKLQNLDKIINVDGVDITVGEGPHVHHRLSQSGLLPVAVPAHVIVTQKGQDLPVLDNLQWPGDHKDKVCYALSLSYNEVPWGAVRHLEVGRQGPQASVAGEAERGVAVKHPPVMKQLKHHWQWHCIQR